MLQMLAELAMKLSRRRIERGSLDFDLPEPEILLDIDEKKIERIVRAERHIGHRLIEECMIAANEAVAEFITSRHLPMVYRIHPGPEKDRARSFATLLHNLGIPFSFKKTPSPHDFSRVIELTKGRPEEKLIHIVMIRTLGRALYDVTNLGHFGLASNCYTHFTSPIRRYPDLLVHRILEAAGGTPEATGSQGFHDSSLRAMAAHCSERERVSMKAEWASRELAAAFFMKDKVGETHSGIISGIASFGFFVELDSLFVEGLVPLRHLKDDYYLVNEERQEVVGRRHKRRFRLGDLVSVRVERVVVDKRWIDFCLVEKMQSVGQ
jgi:ribonuclease R